MAATEIPFAPFRGVRLLSTALLIALGCAPKAKSETGPATKATQEVVPVTEAADVKEPPLEPTESKPVPEPRPEPPLARAPNAQAPTNPVTGTTETYECGGEAVASATARCPALLSTQRHFWKRSELVGTETTIGGDLIAWSSIMPAEGICDRDGSRWDCEVDLEPVPCGRIAKNRTHFLASDRDFDRTLGCSVQERVDANVDWGFARVVAFDKRRPSGKGRKTFWELERLETTLRGTSAKVIVHMIESCATSGRKKFVHPGPRVRGWFVLPSFVNKANVVIKKGTDRVTPRDCARRPRR